MYYESFLYYVQSDDFAWRYEEDEANREENRQEDIQEDESSEELQEYLRLMRKHNVVPARKGKGSFKRKKKNAREEDSE